MSVLKNCDNDLVGHAIPTLVCPVDRALDFSYADDSRKISLPNQHAGNYADPKPPSSSGRGYCSTVQRLRAHTFANGATACPTCKPDATLRQPHVYPATAEYRCTRGHPGDSLDAFEWSRPLVLL